LHLAYQFEVQQADIVYIGYCEKRDYKAEWRVGDDVQFRLKKDKMYLKRPNGKEFMLEFLLQAKLGPDGKPITILGYKKR
jgi:plasmid stabilization system protein ParE